MDIINKTKLNVSAKIMEKLESKNMTIFDLADELGIKSSLVRKVTGCGDYKFDTLIIIFEYLGIELNFH